MEMERINDNTIRVMIENTDLKERGISIAELLGNHEKIESFFYSILSEVDVEHDFGDDDQVTFQILPNRNGLELFISRISEDDQVGDIINNIISHAKKSTSDLDDISDKRRTELQQSDNGDKVEINQSTSIRESKNSNKPALINNVIALKILDFENLIVISDLLQDYSLSSDLFKYDDNFYLVLRFLDKSLSQDDIDNLKSFAIEFLQLSDKDSDVLNEHGQLVYKETALDSIRKIFKHN